MAKQKGTTSKGRANRGAGSRSGKRTPAKTKMGTPGGAPASSTFFKIPLEEPPLTNPNKSSLLLFPLGISVTAVEVAGHAIPGVGGRMFRARCLNSRCPADPPEIQRVEFRVVLTWISGLGRLGSVVFDPGNQALLEELLIRESRDPNGFSRGLWSVKREDWDWKVKAKGELADDSLLEDALGEFQQFPDLLATKIPSLAAMEMIERSSYLRRSLSDLGLLNQFMKEKKC